MDESKQRRALCLKEQREKRIRRPMNAYMLWARVRRAQIAQKYPLLDNKKHSCILGAEWKQLSENEKRPFMKEAERLRQEHRRMYPEFKYASRRKSKSAAKNPEPAMPYGEPAAFHHGSSTAPQVGVYDASYPMHFSYDVTSYYSLSSMDVQHNQAPGSAPLYHGIYSLPVNQSMFNPDLYNRSEKSNEPDSPFDHHNSSPILSEAIHTLPTVSSGFSLPYANNPEMPAYSVPLSYDSQMCNSAMLTPPSSNSPDGDNIISPSDKQEMEYHEMSAQQNPLSSVIPEQPPQMCYFNPSYENRPETPRHTPNSDALTSSWTPYNNGMTYFDNNFTNLLFFT